MNYGLITLYVLLSIILLIAAHDHGKPRIGKYNFWARLFGIGLHLTIVWWALDWRFI